MSACFFAQRLHFSVGHSLRLSQSIVINAPRLPMPRELNPLSHNVRLVPR